MHLQCFLPTRYVKNWEYLLGTRTYYADDLYPICSKLEYRLPGCIIDKGKGGLEMDAGWGIVCISGDVGGCGACTSPGSYART